MTAHEHQPPPRWKGPRPTERECQTTIVLGARLFGWRVLAIRPAKAREDRWLSPIQGDAGYPDLTLAHPDAGVLFVELKRSPNQLEPEQVAWEHVLVASGADWRVVWVPEQMDAFLKELTDLPRRARRGLVEESGP